jgi:hypothetical protein
MKTINISYGDRCARKITKINKACRVFTVYNHANHAKTFSYELSVMFTNVFSLLQKEFFFEFRAVYSKCVGNGLMVLMCSIQYFHV